MYVSLCGIHTGRCFNKSLESDDACLFQTVHDFSYFDMYKSVVFNICYIIFLSNLISEELCGYFHILEVFHRIIEVILFDICSVIFGVFVGILYDTVEKNLRDTAGYQ